MRQYSAMMFAQFRSVEPALAFIRKKVLALKKQLALLIAAFGIGLAPIYLNAQQPVAQNHSAQQPTPRMSAYAPAERIANLDDLKTQLKKYHECTCTCGCYTKDLDRQADRANPNVARAGLDAHRGAAAVHLAGRRGGGRTSPASASPGRCECCPSRCEASSVSAALPAQNSTLPEPVSRCQGPSWRSAHLDVARAGVARRPPRRLRSSMLPEPVCAFTSPCPSARHRCCPSRCPPRSRRAGRWRGCCPSRWRASRFRRRRRR
jgi:hypothetical protein